MPEKPKPPTKNPFARTSRNVFHSERLLKAFFMVTTYTIILCAALVFGKIIINGAPVLAKFGTHFLTRSPETLIQVELDQQKDIAVNTDAFAVLELYNQNAPFTNIRREDRKTAEVQVKIPAGTHPVVDGWISELESQQSGLFIDWKERSTNHDLVIQIDSDTDLSFDSANWTKYRDTIRSHIRVKRTQLTTVNTVTHDITIDQGMIKLSKKTIESLDSTNLIYIIQGMITEDDRANDLFDVEIPEKQTVEVSDQVFKSAIGDEEGKLSTLETTTNQNPNQQTIVTLAAGEYKVPLDSYFDLRNANPTLNFKTRQQSPEGLVMAIFESDLEFTTSNEVAEAMKRQNPELPLEIVTGVETLTPTVVFDLSEPADLEMPNKERVELGLRNPDLKTLSEKTYSYSGGGVRGPLVGTALLVITCIVAALFIGISSSIYLNEYSRKGGFLKAVRLAMLNLAGVPSIIFGLFGLMLFVILAPRVTSTPNMDSKFLIPVFPAITEPSLREQELMEIHVADGVAKDEAIETTKGKGLKRFYNGTCYLSFQGWGTSILAGGLTLAIMVLPVIITACEESLRAVPMGFREASLALGASKWQSIRTAVLPYAFPGILTASVLGITRVAGETAPIMFTAAVAAKSRSPFELPGNSQGLSVIEDFFLQSVQALPYHIYTVAGRIPQSDYTKPMQYGATLLFLIVVMIFAALSVWLRIRARKKLKW